MKNNGVDSMPEKDTRKVTLPMQPIENGRFVCNRIVSFLLDSGPFDMNTIARMDFTNEEREQFAQLIGYSLSGFGELSYVSDEAYEAACLISAGGINELSARNEALRHKLRRIEEGVRIAACEAFNLHPDDLGSDA